MHQRVGVKLHHGWMANAHGAFAARQTGCKSAPKWDPARFRNKALIWRHYLLAGWGPDRRRLGPHQTVFFERDIK
jgi:hypothetical protein